MVNRLIEPALVDVLPSPVLLLRNHRVAYVNPAAHKHFHFNGRPLETYSLWDIIHPDDHPRLQDYLHARRHPEPIDLTIIPGNEPPQTASMTFNPIDDNALVAVVTSAVVTLESLTKTQSEQRLNELKSMMMTTISHEFRTPLSIILSASELIERYHDRLTDDKRNTSLGKIKQQVVHLNNIIDDMSLLVGSEMDPDRILHSTTNLSQLCHDVVTRVSMGIGENHHITLQAGQAPCKIRGDQQMLARVLLNVLENAVTYSKPGSTIQVHIACNNNRTQISIQDEGIGITPDALQMIFEPFFRAPDVINLNGTGLGMSIVRLYVDLHGGSVDVSSIVGKGTRVTIDLPNC